MKTIEKTPKAPAASKATIQLDADLVAKIRASLRAIGRNQTAEEFIEELLGDMLTPHSGLFEGLIENEKQRERIEAKLSKIRAAFSVPLFPPRRNLVPYSAPDFSNIVPLKPRKATRHEREVIVRAIARSAGMDEDELVRSVILR